MRVFFIIAALVYSAIAVFSCAGEPSDTSRWSYFINGACFGLGLGVAFDQLMTVLRNRTESLRKQLFELQLKLAARGIFSEDK